MSHFVTQGFCKGEQAKFKACLLYKTFLIPQNTYSKHTCTIVCNACFLPEYDRKKITVLSEKMLELSTFKFMLIEISFYIWNIEKILTYNCPKWLNSLDSSTFK